MQTHTFLRFLSLLLLFSFVFSCVNDCSGHGNCNAGVCTCNNGYGGDDCSVLDTTITSGVVTTGTLRTYQWHYYHIVVDGAGNTLQISVNQTSRLGDVDVYVKLGTYPTADNNDYADTSDSNSISISISSTQVGTYYIGLYGFWDVSYNVSATILVNCVPACVNGMCINRVCSCFSPYYGDDCSIYDLEIESGRKYFGSADTGKWIFYHLTVAEGQYLRVEVNQTHPAPNDLDVYLKYNQRPSMWSFNYINASQAQNIVMVVETPTAGLWEIGIYGYYGDSYSLVATAAVPPPSVCQNNCSGTTHGSCSHSVCTCNSGYSGPACNNYTKNVELDVQYSGYVASAQWNFYYIHYFTSNSLQISVNQQGDGDVDLYVRNGDYPSRVTYTYADLTIHKTYTINITNPGDENWYLGFYGWIPATYSFSISQIVQCSCSNTLHGSCPTNSTNCVCNLGWAGYQCSQVAPEISSLQVLSYQSIAKNGWNYYYFKCRTHAAIFTMVEQNTTGFLWLFVSDTGYPTLDDYSETNKKIDNYHEIAMVWDDAIDRVIFIGVYGGSTITTTDTIIYSITAWASPI